MVLQVKGLSRLCQIHPEFLPSNTMVLSCSLDCLICLIHAGVTDKGESKVIPPFYVQINHFPILIEEFPKSLLVHLI
jgi:hypothetical protein